jgi:hypothetical protein
MPDIGQSPATAQIFPRATVQAGWIAARLDIITRVLGGEAATADILGVHPAEVSRYKQGHAHVGQDHARIVDLEITIRLLEGFLAESSIRRWLTGINAHVNDRRPASLLRAGRLSDVIGAIEAQQTGAFA